MRATTACTFSTSQLPKLVRTWCVLYILTSKCASSQLSKVLRRWGVLTLFTSKCASRHNGVPFFLSHLPSRLRTRHFREPTFRPSEPQNNVKTHCFATFLPFRTPAFSLFWLSPFLMFSVSYLLPFDFLPFDFLHAWAASWMCFSTCPYCRKFDLETSFDYVHMYLFAIWCFVKKCQNPWNYCCYSVSRRCLSQIVLLLLGCKARLILMPHVIDASWCYGFCQLGTREPQGTLDLVACHWPRARTFSHTSQ